LAASSASPSNHRQGDILDISRLSFAMRST
jgi:hypothetical protein